MIFRADNFLFNYKLPDVCHCDLIRVVRDARNFEVLSFVQHDARRQKNAHASLI